MRGLQPDAAVVLTAFVLLYIRFSICQPRSTVSTLSGSLGIISYTKPHVVVAENTEGLSDAPDDASLKPQS